MSAPDASHRPGAAGPAREPHIGVAMALALTLAAAAVLGAQEPGGQSPAPQQAEADQGAVGAALDFDVPAVADADERLAARLGDEPPVLQPLARAARAFGVDTELMLALAWHESRWRPDAVSPAGAVGVMQVMPGTAQRVVADTDALRPPVDLAAPADNARVGAAYLRRMLDRYDGDPHAALQAYNQGPVPIDAGRPSTRAVGYARRVLRTADVLADARWRRRPASAG